MSQEPEQKITLEMEQIIEHFPDPRNQPLAAVISLHRIRMLRDELIKCQDEQADHAVGQDVQK